MKIKIIKKFPGGPEVGSVWEENILWSGNRKLFIFWYKKWNGLIRGSYKKTLVPEYAEIIEE